jgi:hypothetical protein
MGLELILDLEEQGGRGEEGREDMHSMCEEEAEAKV